MSLLKLKKPQADIHSNYNTYMKFGTITSLLIFIAMFRININVDREVSFDPIEREIVEMEEIVNTVQEQRPPPPPRPSAPVEVPNDEVLHDEILDLDSELRFDLPMAMTMPTPPKADADEEEPDVFIVVERMPELIGGLAQLQSKIVYPEIARLAGIEGRVMVQFIIDEQGRVNNPVVVRGIGGGCDEAAIEAVKNARFTPGMQRGRAVKVSYTLPITFRLNTAQRTNS
jgi:periplasmic protein TonB